MRLSIEENGIAYRKSGCIVKKHRFAKKDLNFTLKTRFSIEENSIMYQSKCTRPKSKKILPSRKVK